MTKKKINILYIEDNEADFVLFSKHIEKLQHREYNLEHVTNHDELMAKVATQSYDIYFIDYTLQGTHTGLELAETLKAQDIDGPFVLLTGIDRHDLQIKSTETGVYDYLLKGEISPSLLERVITHCIAQHTESKRRLQTERALQQNQKMQSLGILASGVAHELNNLLQPIILARDIVESEAGDNKQLKKASDIIRRNADQATYIVNNILGFTRLEGDEKHHVNLKQAVEESLTFVERLLAKDINLIRHNFENVSETEGLINTSGLVHILTNILINAAQSMANKGDIDIMIDIQNIEEEKAIQIDLPTDQEYFTISIADKGHGISENIIDKIFDPFFTTKEAGSGTGLGLSIAYSIVKNWGGAIEAGVNNNQGTIFTVFIPIES